MDMEDVSNNLVDGVVDYGEIDIWIYLVFVMFGVDDGVDDEFFFYDYDLNGMFVFYFSVYFEEYLKGWCSWLISFNS